MEAFQSFSKINKIIKLGDKCFRATYLCIPLSGYIIKQCYNIKIADTVSKVIYDIVARNKFNKLSIDEIYPITNIESNELEFVFQNVFIDKIKSKWNLTIEGSDIYSGNYKYQFYRNDDYDFIENSSSNFSTYVQLIFNSANIDIDKFDVSAFYPLRLKVKLAFKENTKKPDFINAIVNQTFLNYSKKDIITSSIFTYLMISGNLNLQDYRIKFHSAGILKMDLSESFISKIISGKEIINGWIINHIFENVELQLICYPGFKDFFTKLKEEISLSKGKFKSIKHNDLDKKIIGFDKLFSYQRQNISWMDYIEKDIRKHKLFVSTNYKYYVYPSSQKLYKFKINDTYYVNTKYPCRFESYKDAPEIYTRYTGIQTWEQFKLESAGKLFIKGGIIADDIGLGKTASMICHIVNQLEVDKKNKDTYVANNLIILPPRLMKQWEIEFEKFVKNPLDILVINTLRDIKNNKQSSLKDYDVVLLCKSLLSNSSYAEYIALMGSSDNYLNIFNIKWNRIIVDEAHESLSSIMHNGDKYHFPDMYHFKLGNELF